MQGLTWPSTELSLRAQQDAFLGFPASRRVGERGTQERFIRGGGGGKLRPVVKPYSFICHF